MNLYQIAMPFHMAQSGQEVACVTIDLVAASEDDAMEFARRFDTATKPLLPIDGLNYSTWPDITLLVSGIDKPITVDPSGPPVTI